MTSNCASSYDKVAKAEAQRSHAPPSVAPDTTAAAAASASPQAPSRAAYRAYNNHVKALLIRHVLQPWTAESAPHGLSVLDLASGRGGDLAKVLVASRGQQVPVMRYAALDISPASIEEARRRCTDMINHPKTKVTQKPLVAIEVANVFDTNKTWKEHPLLSQPGQYHAVSMQFALHYGCASVETLRAFLQCVSASLVEGGFFVGTTSDGHVLRKHLLEAVEAKKHNKKSSEPATATTPFRITLPDDADPEELSKRLHEAGTTDVPIGIPYRFQLDDLVDDVEYSLPRDVLVAEAQRAGLEPVVDMCKNMYTGFHKSYVPQGDIKPVLSEADVTLVSFYIGFVFQKKTKSG